MKVGVIGLGAMGGSMALNFHKAGQLHAIWNRTPEKAAAIGLKTGALAAESIAHLAWECELIVTCVSQDEDVLEVVQVIVAGIKADSIVADTSTVSSDTAGCAAEILAAKGAHFLDCPVSGGTEGAKAGSLAMMVGGDAAVLARAKDTLAAIAARIVHIGPTGSGQACKAVNQIICAGLYETVAEALAFGQALDLDLEKVIAAIASGAAGNWVLDHRSSFMLNEDFPPGFQVKLHLKDLHICKQMAKRASITHLPITELAMNDYASLIEQGYGEEDTSAVFRLKAKS